METQDKCLPFQKPVKHTLSCDEKKCKKPKPGLNVVYRGRPNDCKERHHQEPCHQKPHCKKEDKCELQVVNHCKDDKCEKPRRKHNHCHDSDTSSDSCSSSSSSSCSNHSDYSEGNEVCVCGQCNDV